MKTCEICNQDFETAPKNYRGCLRNGATFKFQIDFKIEGADICQRCLFTCRSLMANGTEHERIFDRIENLSVDFKNQVG